MLFALTGLLSGTIMGQLVSYPAISSYGIIYAASGKTVYVSFTDSRDLLRVRAQNSEMTTEIQEIKSR